MPFEFGKLGGKKQIPQVGKNLQSWENTGLFWIGKQPVFGCKIGKKTLLSPLFSQSCNVKDGPLKLYQEAI